MSSHPILSKTLQHSKSHNSRVFQVHSTAGYSQSCEHARRKGFQKTSCTHASPYTNKHNNYSSKKKSVKYIVSLQDIKILVRELEKLSILY